MATNWEICRNIEKGYKVPYLDGFLIHIQYVFGKEHWKIALFNGLRVVTRDGSITEVNRMKKMSEQMVRSLLKHIERDNNIL